MNSSTVSDPIVTPVVLQVNVTNIISYRTVNICFSCQEALQKITYKDDVLVYYIDISTLDVHWYKLLNIELFNTVWLYDISTLDVHWHKPLNIELSNTAWLYAWCLFRGRKCFPFANTCVQSRFVGSFRVVSNFSNVCLILLIYYR